MRLISTAYDGAIEGFNRLQMPAPELEGVLAGRGGVTLAMLIAGTAIGYFVADLNRATAISGALGTVMGYIKAGGLRYYPGATPLDPLLNEYIITPLVITLGGLAALKIVSMTSRHVTIPQGVLAAAATVIGAVGTGVLKKFIER